MALTWFEEPASSFWCRLSQYLFPSLPLCKINTWKWACCIQTLHPNIRNHGSCFPSSKWRWWVICLSTWHAYWIAHASQRCLRGQNGYWTSQKHSFQCVRYLHHCLPTHLEHWIVAAVKRCHVSHLSRVWRWDPTRQGRPFRSTFCLDEGHSIDGMAKTICTFPSPS